MTLASQALTASTCLLEIDDSGAHVGIDAHLLAGHCVEGETRRNFGDTLRAFRDDDELDQGDDQKDDGAHYEIAADNEHAKRPDDFTGIGFEQDETGGCDIQGQPVEGGDQEQRWKRRDLYGARDIDRHHQDGHGHRDVDGQEDVEQKSREGNNHEADHDSDHGDQDQVSEAGQNPLKVPPSDLFLDSEEISLNIDHLSSRR